MICKDDDKCKVKDPRSGNAMKDVVTMQSVQDFVDTCVEGFRAVIYSYHLFVRIIATATLT